MGGYGAMAYAARHPGMFEAAASFSGAVNTRHHGSAGISPPLAVAVSVVFGCGRVDWQRLWGDPVLQERIWRAHNPYDLAERLRGTRLYVASGDGTPGPEDTAGRHDPLERAAHAVTRSFAERLEELAIPATTHFYPGTHQWAYWARELRAALPLLLGTG
jgi:S-formylglutathione hydrolase FrmB